MFYRIIIPKKLFEIDSELSIIYTTAICNLYIQNLHPIFPYPTKSAAGII
jgi:hypothetical protein